jgi:hypothetical protein
MRAGPRYADAGRIPTSATPTSEDLMSTRILIIGVAAVSLVGCGSARSGSSAMDAPFLAKANAICVQAVQIQAAHPFPLKSFDVQHPDPSQLPVIADYFSQYGQAATTTSQLTALGAPPDHRADWQHMLSLLQQVSTNADAQIRADRNQDLAAFAATAAESQTLTAQIDKLGRSLGFAPADPCAREFG